MAADFIGRGVAMLTVWIPPLLRHLTHGQAAVQADGSTVRALIAALDAQYPGLQARLCDVDDLRPGLAVVIDAQVAREGLAASVVGAQEVHFVPAIAGGQ